MADIEKVIKGLRCLARTEEPMANPCAKCDYKDRANFAFCVVDVAKDALELLEEKQPKKKQIWVIKKGNKYLHSYRAGRKSWTTKGSGISIWNSADKSTAEFFASAVDGIVVEWDGEQE